uniref:Portal protein n=1 Tax=Pseudomonas phage vB_PaeS_HTN2 TaxID=3236647 RepID=A0AB39AHY8_9VIRU
MSGLKSQHPEYDKYSGLWKKLRDFYEGPEKVKQQGVTYLPATVGMELDGMEYNGVGYKAYQAYKQRARVPEYVQEAVEILVGLMHQKAAIIELPPEMEYLREHASPAGEPLSAIHRRLNVEQVLVGRVGVLADFQTPLPGETPKPYLAMYECENIPNWDATEYSDGRGVLNLVVLNESGYRRAEDGFTWQQKEQYRVLVLGDLVNNEEHATYRCAVFTSENLEFNPQSLVSLQIQGRELDAIPFVFINTKDLLPKPDIPPLASLLYDCIGIYQGEADYRQNLFMQGQDTLVVKGGMNQADGCNDGAIRVGAGSRIDVDEKGDAKYIGVSGSGLQEQRIALDNDRKRAQIKAGRLVQAEGAQQESGVALSTRFNAQTATLNQIASTGAAGLERALRFIARWMGLDESKVKVTPNTEYVNFSLEGRNFVDLMTAKQMGLPISLESLHAALADRGMTVMDYINELAAIQKEQASGLVPEVTGAPGSGPGGTAPGAPVINPAQE